MATLLDYVKNDRTLENLNKITEMARQEKEKEVQERHEAYLALRIFHTHEEALDYCIEHPYKSIQWYGKIIFWDEYDNIFVSEQQENSFDGIMCYDVVRKYSRETLLKGAQEHVTRLKNTFENIETEMYTENGTLDWVHLY